MTRPSRAQVAIAIAAVLVSTLWLIGWGWVA